MERVLALGDLGRAQGVGSSLTLGLCCPEPCATPGAAGETGEACRWNERRGGAKAWNSFGLLTAGFAAVLSCNLPHVGAKE